MKKSLCNVVCTIDTWAVLQVDRRGAPVFCFFCVQIGDWESVGDSQRTVRKSGFWSQL